MDEPARNRAIRKLNIQPANGRKPDWNQPNRLHETRRLGEILCDVQNHPRTEGKPGHGKGHVRVTPAHERQNHAGIFNLALPIAKGAFAQVDPAEIKTHHNAARAPKAASHAVDDLIVHGPAVQGVGMTDERRLGDDAVLRLLDQRLQSPRRSLNEQRFDPPGQLVGPEVDELQIQTVIAFAKHRDSLLQDVAILAADANQITIDGRLYLQLAVLDGLVDVARLFNWDS